MNEWELLTGETARRVEVLNLRQVKALIEANLLSRLHHWGTDEEGRCRLPLNSDDVCELHFTHTRLLLLYPGLYRTCHVQVRTTNSGVLVHDAPPPEDVPGLMNEFDRTMARMWTTADLGMIAAYALWWVNYVHPFVNGNGRAARAIMYAAVAHQLGKRLPGRYTMLEMITNSRAAYYEVLALATDAYRRRGRPDLAPIYNYVVPMINRQLSSIDRDEPGADNDDEVLSATGTDSRER